LGKDGTHVKASCDVSFVNAQYIQQRKKEKKRKLYGYYTKKTTYT